MSLIRQINFYDAVNRPTSDDMRYHSPNSYVFGINEQFTFAWLLQTQSLLISDTILDSFMYSVLSFSWLPGTFSSHLEDKISL